MLWYAYITYPAYVHRAVKEAVNPVTAAIQLWHVRIFLLKTLPSVSTVKLVFSPLLESRLSNSYIIQVTGAKPLSAFTMECDRCVKGSHDVVTTAEGDRTE